MAEPTTEAEFEDYIRCEHGKIVLACTESPCEKQDAYLANHRERMAAWEEQGINNARKAVRPWAADWSR